MANPFDRFILKTLTEGVNEVAEDARNRAAWSSTIPDAIEVGEARVVDGNYEISIRLNLKKAPQAAAFEFGSGIHSTKGPKETYIIAPKNKATLAIPLERWNSFQGDVIPGPKMIGEGENGLLLYYVDHPGVAPRPFLVPALMAYKPKLVTRIFTAFRSGLRGIIKRIEIVE